jgi:hypothetical protein
MENASKALIIAGAVLIGILIISMGVLLATTLQKTARTHYTSMSTNEIQKFNSEITKNFIIENGNTYITAQGIITLKNILNTETYKGSNIQNNISVIVENNSDAEFLKKNGTKNEKYKVEINYSDQGMINKIIISKI